MDIHRLPVGPFEANCYVFSNEPGRAVVVDPGAEPDTIADFLGQHKVVPAAYVLTHGHLDHISALGVLYARFPAPVAIHANDLEWAFDSANQIVPFYPPPQRPAEIARVLQGGETFVDAGVSYTVLATPGHSPGCVCLHSPADKILLSGDTLFAGSVGRTDLPGGDSRTLSQSLQLLAALDERTQVYPGHGEATDIGRERRTNFFMR